MNLFQMSSQMGQLSDSQLAQVAQNPPEPGAQLIAIQELDRRKQMRQQSVSKPPQSTVLQDRIAESMPRQPTSGASNPVMANMAALAQRGGPQPQQPQGYACGGSVHHYAEGGSVNPYAQQYLSDFSSIMPALSDAMPGPKTPEEWMALMRQFQGEDRMAPFEAQLASRDADLTADHKRDAWLALAQAGFDMASTGDIGHGGMAGLAALQSANSNYRQSQDALMQRRMGLASARQTRDDAAGATAFNGYTGRQNSAFNAGLGAAADVGRLRDSAADRAAANWRDTNDIQVLADALFKAKQHTLVQDGQSWVEHAGRSGDSPGALRPVMRSYSEEDAMREAAQIFADRAAGRMPDDLSERQRSAQAVLADINSSQADKAQARAILLAISSGQIGNTGSTTSAGGGLASSPNAAVATGTLTAGERASVPATGQGSIAEYQRTHRPSPREDEIHDPLQ